MDANNTTLTQEKSDSIESPMSRMAIFAVYMTLSIPSIPCFIFLFIRFIYKRILLQKISHHIIFGVLFCSFLQVVLDLPAVLNTLYTETALIPTNGFCKFWATLDYSCNVSILMLMAFGSIERHLLIFHRNFIQKHLIILHYVPLIVSIVYPFILYTYLVCFYPCTNYFNYGMITCGGPCYYYEASISVIDQFLNICAPIVLATIANITLLLRVLSQKRRMKQQQMWKKNRKLVAQLLSFVILHNLVWWPMLITSLILFYSANPSPILVQLTINVIPYGIYIVVLLCPFLLTLGLTEIWPQALSDWLQQKTMTQTVHPVTVS